MAETYPVPARRHSSPIRPLLPPPTPVSNWLFEILEPPIGMRPPAISGHGPMRNPSFLSGKPFLQIHFTSSAVLPLILPVQFIVILRNGCGRIAASCITPLILAPEPAKAHQVEFGGIKPYPPLFILTPPDNR